MLSVQKIGITPLLLSRVSEGEGEPSPFVLEQAQLFRSDKRRRQYILGRLAAEEMLRSLINDASPITNGPRGEPIWPPGVVGSITHTSSIAIAVGALAEAVRGVGVDAEEKARRISEGVIEKISKQEELGWIYEKREEVNERALTLFSVKESIFKALYPTYRRELSFRDAQVTIGETGTITATLSHTAGDVSIHEELLGQVIYDPSFVITLVILPKRT